MEWQLIGSSSRWSTYSESKWSECKSRRSCIHAEAADCTASNAATATTADTGETI
jgi:hypothetical protein